MVLLNLFFLSIFSVRAENTVTYVSIPVKEVQQAYSNWCWAAGSESILYYCKNYLGFGREATQWDIVKYIYGSYVNKSASLYDIQRALSYYGVGSSRMIPVSGFVISYGQIAEQIVNYRSPIGLEITVTVSQNHFVVLNGIWQYFDSNGFLQNYITIMDPAIGGVITIPDSELRDDDNYRDYLDAIRVFKP
ncbi:hypothetical protein Calkr_1838 [Caldicellulosiruptor acetigenus I77R1B]|uniref:Peptidase C39-like domain-containing protein n=1 Tax=Caldicellulosiruptor acetigenus (strain ATCC 700853 / DSM 12137 / I77R1B) TaxID=632335 RepID=E4S455_CALA7|nr:hypothetical protein Calkr_1838 [Caldicellulosiruptor acetigenus I77R1B]